MSRQVIRNLHSSKRVQTHWCDVVYDEQQQKCYLERKDRKTKSKEAIPWEDVKYQVESFLEEQRKAI